jgi:uncharacterized membrane protein HdeD (DUF308 family)
VAGIVALAAGILTFVWPGITVYVVALLLAWYLIIFGVMHLISALAGRKVSYWWTQLLLGVAEIFAASSIRQAGRRAEHLLG